MKKFILGFLAIAMVAFFSNSVVAQTTATATNDAKATIIAPITITQGVDLEFGDIIAGAGDVSVATDGARTIPAAMLAGTQVGTITAATFIVTGQTGYTYAITLPANDVVTLTLVDANPMAVKDFVSSPATTSTLTAGDNTILVGATLTVAIDQDAGDYTGTFDVTVAYN